MTYLLHSDHWRSASSYVALSRHRDSGPLFAAGKAAPWIMAEGGLAGLNDKQRTSAAQSFAAWAEAKPDLAARYGFTDYVAYVQAQWANERRLDPLDRLARQMSCVEERRAASGFVQGAREPTKSARKPQLSIIAGIVGDYLGLCFDPAIDWVRRIAEDLRHKASERRALELQDTIAAAAKEQADQQREGAVTSERLKILVEEAKAAFATTPGAEKAREVFRLAQRRHQEYARLVIRRSREPKHEP